MHHILQQLIWSLCQVPTRSPLLLHCAPCHECTRPPKQTEFPAIYPGNATGQFSVRPWRVGAPAPRACPQFLLNTIKKNLTDAAAQAQPWVDAVQGVALSRRCCSRHQQAAIRGPLRARTFADQILLRWKKPFFLHLLLVCATGHVQSHLKPVLRRPDAQVLGRRVRHLLLRDVTECPIQCVGRHLRPVLCA